MPQYLQVTDPSPAIDVIRCNDCRTAWKEDEDQFVTQCPKCGSNALDEFEAVLNPGTDLYIAIQPPESHPL